MIFEESKLTLKEKVWESFEECQVDFGNRLLEKATTLEVFETNVGHEPTLPFVGSTLNKFVVH